MSRPRSSPPEAADPGRDSSWFGSTVAFSEEIDRPDDGPDDGPFWAARVRRLLHGGRATQRRIYRSEEHTSELQSH